MKKLKFTFSGEAGLRLDKFVAAGCDLSREYAQKLIDKGNVKINGHNEKPGTRLKIADRVEVIIPDPVSLKLKPLDMKLDIIYEDEGVIVINKPAGVVVHPGAGSSHINDSLVNALLAHCKGSLSGIGGVMRPGIVHRLDKNTSGVLVVAKNDKVHRGLADQFKDRTVKKEYVALVCGLLQHKK